MKNLKKIKKKVGGYFHVQEEILNKKAIDPFMQKICKEEIVQKGRKLHLANYRFNTMGVEIVVVAHNDHGKRPAGSVTIKVFPIQPYDY